MDLIGTDLKYGSNLCIPELNEHFGRRIPLQVCIETIKINFEQFFSNKSILMFSY